jgi:hypothetical protein
MVTGSIVGASEPHPERAAAKRRMINPPKSTRAVCVVGKVIFDIGKL